VTPAIRPPIEQRGAVLLVAVIMLLLMTVLVASTFTLSSTNLKSVTNTQLRNEAIAAANAAIEQVMTSSFSNSPAPESINIDLNNDGATDYTVQFAAPVCISAGPISTAALPPSSITLPASFTAANANYFDTVWDLDATVADTASGASAHVHQGVRVLLTTAQYAAVCT
jgi:type II secretory pathway pseudopilin PulG